MKICVLKLWTVLLAVAFLIALPALAQEAPKVEITGDYTYLRFNATLPALNNRNLNGGGGDISFFLSPYFAGKAEFMFYGSTDYTTTFGSPLVTAQGIVPAGTYSANGTMKTFLFGPVIKARRKHFEPFAEILFGLSHINAYANLSKVIALAPGSTFKVQGTQDPFTLAAGGGIDIPVSSVIAVRVAELDYVLTRLTNPLTSTNNQNHFRYLGGLQFRIGGGK
jgi:outer membrane protein with beta-barrel domain